MGFEGFESGQLRHWFACCTPPRHERAVAVLLGRQGIENYLPLIPRVSRWSDRSKTILWPVFPNYLFARMARHELWRLRATPGVRFILANGSRASSIGDHEIANVRRVVAGFAHAGSAPAEADLWATDDDNLNKGDLVRVVRGVFAGVHGRLREWRGRSRLLVTIVTTGRAIALNIDATMVERVSEQVSNASGDVRPSAPVCWALPKRAC